LSCHWCQGACFALSRYTNNMAAPVNVFEMCGVGKWGGRAVRHGAVTTHMV
jgi:hypothetical protein